MRKEKAFSFIMILMLFMCCVGNVSALAVVDNNNVMENTSDFVADLYNGKVTPVIEDEALIGSDMLESLIADCNDYIIDVRKINDSETIDTYEATIVVDQTIELQKTDDSTELSIVEPSLDMTESSLISYDEEWYCDVVFSCTIEYTSAPCPDPDCDYMYRMTKVKGSVVDIQDSQISVTRLDIGYAMQGNYYVYGTQTKDTGEEVDAIFKTKISPVEGTTYYDPVPDTDRYYMIDDSYGGLTGRCKIYVARQGSSFTGSSVVTTAVGTAYGTW